VEYELYRDLSFNASFRDKVLHILPCAGKWKISQEKKGEMTFLRHLPGASEDLALHASRASRDPALRIMET
jgi:hypothetical protein